MCTYVDNIDYFESNRKGCYSACVGGYTFQNVIVTKPRWLDIEGPCA
jgi:hypothetical protein